MEEESIADYNNVTANIFSNASNTNRKNANRIFRSEKIDKSDELVDSVNNLTTNDAECYESKTATTGNAQVNLNAIQKHLLTLATEIWNKNY